MSILIEITAYKTTNDVKDCVGVTIFILLRTALR